VCSRIVQNINEITSTSSEYFMESDGFIFKCVSDLCRICRIFVIYADFDMHVLPICVFVFKCLGLQGHSNR